MLHERLDELAGWTFVATLDGLRTTNMESFTGNPSVLCNNAALITESRRKQHFAVTLAITPSNGAFLHCLTSVTY